MKARKGLAKIILNSYKHHTIFTDEIGFNDCSSLNYGYSKKGPTPVSFNF